MTAASFRSALLTTAAAACLALAGCSQTASAPLANMSGTRDLVTVGDFLFVTSSDRSELRVLDLVPPIQRSDEPTRKLEFVSAPNVLEPLSIPVLDRPTALARDVRYPSAALPEGQLAVASEVAEVEGPYVYAMSEGSPEISVVGPISAAEADARRFAELRRFREAAPVTAIAARGAQNSGDPSRLYIALFDGARAEIRFRELPGLDQLGAADEASLASRSLGIFNDVLLPNEAVVALLPLPDPNKLVVATRSAEGRSGRTLEIDTVLKTSRVYNFPAPVRILATHAVAVEPVPAPTDAVPNPDPSIPRPVVLRAGRYVYGVLDESSCRDRFQPDSNHPAAVTPPCRGVMAVDSNTGEIAHQIIGGKDAGPMLPIGFGTSLPTSMILVSNARINQPSGGGSLEYAVVGFVTVATGQIVLFEASALRAFDIQPTRVVNGETVGVPTVGVLYRKADGTEGTYPDHGLRTTSQTDPKSAVTVSEGSTLNEIIGVTLRGLIPGWVGLNATPTDPHQLPLAPGAPIGRLRPDDGLELASTDGACTGQVRVASVTAAAITTVEALPPSCVGRPIRYAVRAAPGADNKDTTHELWVVAGEVSGYLGRVKNNSEFLPEVTRYYTRTDTYNAMFPAPQIHFYMEDGSPDFQTGDRFELITTSGFAPYSVTFDLSYDATFAAGLAVPSAIAYRHGVYDGKERWRVFISYPASKGLLEVNLPTLAPGAQNTQNYVPYR